MQHVSSHRAVSRRQLARAAFFLLFWSPVLALLALPASAQTVAVAITDSLDPAVLTVAPNTTVTWDNLDSERHRVASTSGPDEFDSGNLETGESFSFTFTLEGTYQYEDSRDPDLSNYWGTVIVSFAGGEPPPPTGSADFTMSGRVFRPSSITIDAGATVTFLNDDDRDHTVTASDGAYDSGIMNTGDTFQRVYSSAGTFQFFCAIHPDMVATVVVNGSGGEPPPPPPPPDPPSPPPPGDVEIVDFAFAPETITVSPGTTVTWVNAGAALHTVTATDGSFDSGFLSTNDTFARSFATEGTFPIFCTLHPGMTGTVLVTDGSAPPPPPAPPPDPPPPPSVSGDVLIVDFAYQPGSITIDPGTTLTFANAGVAPHTVTARSGLFDSGLIASGDTYTRTFDDAGTFQIFCAIHPDMAAEVIVPLPDGTAPPPVAPPPPPPLPEGGDIQIFDFGYSPSNVTVPAGTTLSWVNTGVAPHTVTDRAGSFDSGFLSTGDTFSRRFDNAGTFVIFCTIHPSMQATVAVTGADGAAPPPPAAPAPVVPVAVQSGDIEMGDFFYAPATVTIRQGGTLRWVNAGAALHTITARDGSFDSGFKATGESYVRTFDEAGTFDVFCTIHPQMVGTVTVLDPSGNTPAAAPAVVGPGSEAAADGGDGGPVRGPFAQLFDFGYRPGNLVVTAGAVITFFNGGAAPHTVTDVDGSFDSGIMQSGDRYEMVIDDPGFYSIFCTLHPQMVATILVNEAIVPGASEQGSTALAADALPGSSDGVATSDPDWHQVPTNSAAVVFGLLAFLLAIPTAVWWSWRRAVTGPGH